MTNTEDVITDRIEQRQLKWYGHIMRMKEERWPRRAIEYCPRQRKKRGRPKQTWMEGIRKAMEKRNLAEEDWRDRQLWRVRCEMRQ